MINIDRNTLYEELWSLPTQQVAMKYGISDVGLAKICRKHQIPRPPRGYWARVRSGQSVRRTPLPKVGDDLQQVYIQSATMPGGEQTPPVEQPRERIKVADALAEPHRLVAAAVEQLRTVEPGADGLVSTDASSAADICVRKVTVDRAVRVFDTFAKAWESEGGEICIGTPDGQPCTLAAIGDDAVNVRLIETTEPPRRRRLADNASVAPVPRLCFSLGSGGMAGLKDTWGDTSTIRLEKMLRPMIDALRRYILAKRQEMFDEECRERQRELAQAARQAMADEKSREFYFRQELIEIVQRWQQAEGIRSYLAAIERHVEAGQVKVVDGESYRTYREWAIWFADDMDPLVRAGPL